ncbi:hypothetical protein [Phytoactinopolyspora halotolerans]|uniref:Uncharacterized protein n=1 Tax=Phytoactinopolyspora halotolerans TaxID=1981512 RepID=A0A6L9SE54_9ACTN|nr:hypothetical protein [Phytoactinopolyspora halotolerans]NEE02791.1 hypothetical protein [Phytoactinopolyspora halotolerans]
MPDGRAAEHAGPEHGELWTGPEKLDLDEPGTPPADVPPPDMPGPDSPQDIPPPDLPSPEISTPDLSSPDLPAPSLPTPDLPHPEDDGVSLEELEFALERAKLVAEDCAAILKPALQAMADGAWVSRSGDEFSLALEDNARITTEAAERVVEIIEAELQRRRNTHGLEPKAFMPADSEAGV